MNRELTAVAKVRHGPCRRIEPWRTVHPLVIYDTLGHNIRVRSSSGHTRPGSLTTRLEALQLVKASVIVTKMMRS